MLEIDWKVPAAHFKVDYQDEKGEWKNIEFGRNKSEYGDLFTNSFKMNIRSNKLRIVCLQRVFASILSGGDINDENLLGYEIRDLRLFGCVDCPAPQ